MIWVLAGTTEGREIISLLKERGYRVLATATTPYGETLARNAGADVSLQGKLSVDDMIKLIEERGITHVVDATHPFAIEASKNAIEACKVKGTPYIRLEREKVRIDNPLIHRCQTFEEAAKKAASLGRVIFCAIGTSRLHQFLKEAGDSRRVVARVLPTVEAVEKCRSIGLEPKDIVALQGGGSLELNTALLKAYGAEVIVTKESGAVGGEDAKIQAALSLGIPVVLVSRPKLDYPRVVKEYRHVIHWLEEVG